MSDEPIEELLADDEVPPGDAAFRSRLRADFVAGRLSSLHAQREAPRHPATWFIPLSAAAALLLWVLWGAGRDDAAWSSDGRGVDLARALNEGAGYTSGAAPVDAWTDDGLHVRLMPETTLAEETSNLAEGRTIAIERGELLVWLAPEHGGHGLAVATPDTAVRITGTGVSVAVSDTISCVCVEHGVVAVLATGLGIEGGHSWIAYRGGQPPYLGPWSAQDFPMDAAHSEAHQASLLRFATEMQRD